MSEHLRWYKKMCGMFCVYSFMPEWCKFGVNGSRIRNFWICLLQNVLFLYDIRYFGPVPVPAFTSMWFSYMKRLIYIYILYIVGFVKEICIFYSKLIT
jgi:hypothetical protein